MNRFDDITLPQFFLCFDLSKKDWIELEVGLGEGSGKLSLRT